MPLFKFPYTKTVSLSSPDIAKFRFNPILKVGLLKDSSFIRTEAYIDTGSPWCLFDKDFAKVLGIGDYTDTKESVPLSGIGGGENKAYFWNLTLAIFKDFKNLKLKDTLQVETKIGFLEKPKDFPNLLGVYGFLDQFSFKANIPEGYFEIEPIFD